MAFLVITCWYEYTISMGTTYHDESPINNQSLICTVSYTKTQCIGLLMTSASLTIPNHVSIIITVKSYSN